MKYEVDIIPVCTDCMELDKTDHTVKLCERCGIGYCPHFASDIDVKYCGNCMTDVNFSEHVIVKEQIYHNEQGQETYRRRQIAKQLNLSGSDWLFANYQIGVLSDEQLLVSIEYHRNIANAMLLERETRKTEHLAKLRGIKVVLRPRGDVDSTGAMKMKPLKKAPTPDAITQAIITMLEATGNKATPENIEAMKVLMNGGK